MRAAGPEADVDTPSYGDVSLFPSGGCYLGGHLQPLVGTWDEGATDSLSEQGDVAFPALTGCGTFRGKPSITLLELHRLTLTSGGSRPGLTKGPETCPDGRVGTARLLQATSGNPRSKAA